MRIALLLFIIATNAFSSSIEINFNNFHSTISITEKEIKYQDTTTDLSLKNVTCSQHIYKRLSGEIIREIQSLSGTPIKSGPFLSVLMNSTTLYGRPNTPSTNYLYHFIEIIKAAKIEARLNCKEL